MEQRRPITSLHSVPALKNELGPFGPLGTGDTPSGTAEDTQVPATRDRETQPHSGAHMCIARYLKTESHDRFTHIYRFTHTHTYIHTGTHKCTHPKTQRHSHTQVGQTHTRTHTHSPGQRIIAGIHGGGGHTVHAAGDMEKQPPSETHRHTHRDAEIHTDAQ